MVDEKDIEYGKIFHRQLDVIKEQEKLLDHKDSTIKALVSLCISNGIISRGLACQYLGCGREELDEILDKVATNKQNITVYDADTLLKVVNMRFEDYWENYGELHASMCGGDIKQFAKEIWMSAKGNTEELKEAAIALVQRLELDKDVKKNNWWLNERAKIMELIDDNEDGDDSTVEDFRQPSGGGD